MVTFAYGSNMNWNQMRERCPSSRFVGIAVLRDHKLAVMRKFGNPQPNPPLPNRAYKSLILAGARYWHLPEEYIRELEQIEVSE